MAGKVRTLVLRQDPCSQGADPRTLRVSGRIRAVRARTRVLSARMAELTSQFLDADLVQQSGPEQGRPLTRQGRLTWLSRLAALHRSYCAACDEEVRLQALLRRIQGSLDSTSVERRDSLARDRNLTQPRS